MPATSNQNTEFSAWCKPTDQQAVEEGMIPAPTEPTLMFAEAHQSAEHDRPDEH